MRILRAALFFSLSLLTSQAFATTEKYYVDPSQFTAAFQVPAQDNKSVNGTFTNATGSFSYDPDSKTFSNLRFAVDATSISTSSKNSTHDMRVLFDPNAYPEISFTSSSSATLADNHGEIKGTLKVHGQSKPVTIDVTKVSDKGFSFKCSVRRAEFAMVEELDAVNHFAETINLSFEVQAIRQ